MTFWITLTFQHILLPERVFPTSPLKVWGTSESVLLHMFLSVVYIIHPTAHFYIIPMSLLLYIVYYYINLYRWP